MDALMQPVSSALDRVRSTRSAIYRNAKGSRGTQPYWTTVRVLADRRMAALWHH